MSSEEELKHGENESDAPVSQKDYEAVLQKVRDLEGLKEQWIRAAADFENAKKRLMRERDEYIKFSQENFARELLPVIDNLERSIAHMGGDAKQDPSLKNVLAGVQMVVKQFGEILKNHGVKKVPSVGEVFNPHHHEAMGYVEGEGKPDEVVDEIEAGYFYHDRLLRAAKVRVRMPKVTTDPTDEKVDDLT